MFGWRAATCLLLVATLSGCGGSADSWPWAQRGVPITRPTTSDANAVADAVPVPEANQPAFVRPAPLFPAVPPGPAAPITKPTDLVDLLTVPRAASTTAVAAVTEPPAAGGTVATQPVAAAAAEPPEPAGEPKVLGPREVVAASVLQVNQRFLTVDDILRRVAPRIIAIPKDLGEDAFRQRVGPLVAEEIHSQVTRALVLGEAEKKLTDEQKKQIDVEVQKRQREMVAEAGGSKTALKVSLQKRGTTLEDVMTDVRQREVSTAYLRGRFLPAIIISRQMLWDHYRAHRRDYETDKRVQMQIIAAPFRGFWPAGTDRPSQAEQAAAKQAARAHIGRAAAALAGGESFGAVAKRLSKGIKADAGGVWPLMPAGSFREAAVEQAAFALAEGQTAGPVETDSGYYIVKALRVRPGRIVPFEEAQEDIADKLRDEQYRKLTDEYYRDLLAAATIVHSERFIQFAIDQAVRRFWKR